MDTLTLFSKNLNQRSLTPRWPLTPCLLRSHVWLYPRIIVSKSHDNTSMYVDTVINFAKYHIHTHTTYILHTTYRMSDHIVSYRTQFRQDNYWTQFRRDNKKIQWWGDQKEHSSKQWLPWNNWVGDHCLIPLFDQVYVLAYVCSCELKNSNQISALSNTLNIHTVRSHLHSHWDQVQIPVILLHLFLKT